MAKGSPSRWEQIRERALKTPEDRRHYEEKRQALIRLRRAAWKAYCANVQDKQDT